MFFHCGADEGIKTGVLEFGFLLGFVEQFWGKVQQPQEKLLNLLGNFRHATTNAPIIILRRLCRNAGWDGKLDMGGWVSLGGGGMRRRDGIGRRWRWVAKGRCEWGQRWRLRQECRGRPLPGVYLRDSDYGCGN